MSSKFDFAWKKLNAVKENIFREGIFFFYKKIDLLNIKILFKI